MNRNLTTLLAIVLVLTGGGFLWAKLRYPGRATRTLPASTCDAKLWDHVYEKDRLDVVEPCTEVEGRVIYLHFNRDGDVHIALAPDDRKVLNFVNATHADGQLVVEIVCEHPPAEATARAQCEDFHSSVTLPRVNDHIRVTGAYVTDRDNGWREVHPVTRIDILQ